MLGKVADFFEQEVDDSVEALSSLLEPIIMVILGTLIGGLVVAMYLPIFKVGQVRLTVIHRLPIMLDRDWATRSAQNCAGQKRAGAPRRATGAAG
jgi:hypothetical protein